MNIPMMAAQIMGSVGVRQAEIASADTKDSSGNSKLIVRGDKSKEYHADILEVVQDEAKAIGLTVYSSPEEIIHDSGHEFLVGQCKAT